MPGLLAEQSKANQNRMEENHLHCRMEAGEVSADRKVALITGITGEMDFELVKTSTEAQH